MFCAFLKWHLLSKIVVVKCLFENVTRGLVKIFFRYTLILIHLLNSDGNCVQLIDDKFIQFSLICRQLIRLGQSQTEVRCSQKKITMTGVMKEFLIV